MSGAKRQNTPVDPVPAVALVTGVSAWSGGPVGWFLASWSNLPQPRVICTCMATFALAGAAGGTIAEVTRSSGTATRATTVPAKVYSAPAAPIPTTLPPGRGLHASK